MTQTVESFMQDLRKSNTFFSVTTTRKNDKKEGGVVVARKGEPIHSTYRFGVPATKEEATTRLDPGVRVLEDSANGVITAYDVQKKGFRRINLDGVTQVKAKGFVYEVRFENDDWVLVQTGTTKKVPVAAE